jgi:predicted GNAT family acetyltransferase
VIPGVGSRIGPVYTPLEHRGRGYATRVVAEYTAARLAAGDPAFFLDTTWRIRPPNAIYARIGYQKVCEAAEYSFGSSA